MCKTRVEAVDALCVDVTYWVNSSQTQEELFCLARMFAGEADRQQDEGKQLRAANTLLLAVDKAAREFLVAHRPDGPPPRDELQALIAALVAVAKAEPPATGAKP